MGKHWVGKGQATRDRMAGKQRCDECLGTGMEVPGNPEDLGRCFKCGGSGREEVPLLDGTVTRHVLEAGYHAGLTTFANELRKRVAYNPDRLSPAEVMVQALRAADDAQERVVNEVYRELVHEVTKERAND